MPQLGIVKCNRCRLQELQDEAERDGQAITIRKSAYGLTPKTRGLDIYIHPKSVEIPSHLKFLHDGDPGKVASLCLVLDENDPRRYWQAWFPDVPDKCKCTLFGGR